jgi:plasmid stability protein
MADWLIHDFDDELKREAKAYCAKHGISLKAWITTLIQSALKARKGKDAR